MQQIKNNVGYIILAIAAIIIATVAWLRAEPAAAPTGSDVSSPSSTSMERETELPDFAYIEERNGERVLVNARDGYELVLEDNWVPVYNTNVIKVLTDTEVPSGELTASFVILRGDALSNNLEEEIDFWLQVNQSTCNDCYEFIEYFNLNSRKLGLYKDASALGDSLFYFLIEGEHLFIINTKNYGDEQSRNLINSLEF